MTRKKFAYTVALYLGLSIVEIMVYAIFSTKYVGDHSQLTSAQSRRELQEFGGLLMVLTVTWAYPVGKYCAALARIFVG